MLRANPFVSRVYVLARELATLFGQDPAAPKEEGWKETKQQQQKTEFLLQPLWQSS